MKTKDPAVLADIQWLCPLPHIAVKALRLSTDESVLMARIAAWEPVSSAPKKGDPRKWIARSRGDWCEETGLTLWRLRVALDSLVRKGLVERTLGRWGADRFCFLRTSSRLKQLGWKAFSTDAELRETQLRSGESLNSGVEAPSTPYNQPTQPAVTNSQDKTDSKIGGSASPPRFHSPGEVLKAKKARKADMGHGVLPPETLIPPSTPPAPPPPPAPPIAVHASAQAVAVETTSTQKAVEAPPGPAEVHTPQPTAAKAPSGLPGASAASLAASWVAQQKAKATAPIGSTGLAALEEAWRQWHAQVGKFAVPWSTKTKSLMKRFAAHMPDPAKAHEVLACVLDEWEEFRTFAVANYEGWKLAAQPVADQVAVQLEACANWWLGLPERQAALAAALAKAEQATAKAKAANEAWKLAQAEATAKPKAALKVHPDKIPATLQETEAVLAAYGDLDAIKAATPAAPGKPKITFGKVL